DPRAFLALGPGDAKVAIDRLTWVAGSALPPPLSPGCDVEFHGLGHERLDRGFVHAVSIEVVDCSDDFAVQPGIEEIAASHAGTPRERQPYGALEHVDEADVSVVRPKRNSLRFGGLLVLDHLDGSRVGGPDRSSKRDEHVLFPAALLRDDVVDLLGIGLVTHARILARRADKINSRSRSQARVVGSVYAPHRTRWSSYQVKSIASAGSPVGATSTRRSGVALSWTWATWVSVPVPPDRVTRWVSAVPLPSVANREFCRSSDTSASSSARRCRMVPPRSDSTSSTRARAAPNCAV